MRLTDHTFMPRLTNLLISAQARMIEHRGQLSSKFKPSVSNNHCKLIPSITGVRSELHALPIHKAQMVSKY